ncbi:MAG: 30S ribosomal protein S6--L-glutamate ligase [Bdellovibrionota bacterium]
MRILILSSSRKLYSTKRLVEEARARDHVVEVVKPTQCYMDVASGAPMVYFKNKKLDKIDVVIPRIGASISSYGMAIVRQCEMMHIYCMNSSNAIGRSRDKLRSLQILSQKKLPLPKTSFANSTQQTDMLIKLVGGAPSVVKLTEGSQGRGVILAETRKASESLIDAFRELRANFLVQEFIKDAKGSDIRCFVIGEKVVGTMMRVAKEGEFRSNIHRGGTGIPVKITPTERKIAIAAARAMRLNVAGVDLIRSETGPKILEVNSSPGLEGIETCTNKNIAVEIIKFVEKDYKNIKKDY